MRASEAIAFGSLALFLGMFGCGKKSQPGTCYRAADNACVEYAASEGAAGKRMCVGHTWTDGAGTCPKGSVGTCTKQDVSEQLFGGPPNNYTKASARTACEFAKGTFKDTSP